MIRDVFQSLDRLDLDLSAEEIADALWLGIQMRRADPDGKQGSTGEEADAASQSDIPTRQSPIRSTPQQRDTTNIGAKAYLSSGSGESSAEAPRPHRSVPFKAPAASALPNPLLLARAMRPLMRKYPSCTEMVLDEEETINRIVDDNLWTLALKPAQERWFDLVMVIEDSPSVAIWRETLREWLRLVKHHGAFRDVRCWQLSNQASNNNGDAEVDSSAAKLTYQLVPAYGSNSSLLHSRSPKELVEPGGRQLTLLITDCVSPLWQQGTIYPLLETWSNQNSLSILQVLPERYWSRSVLGRGRFVQFSSFVPEPQNVKLRVEAQSSWKAPIQNLAQALKLPIVTFSPESLQQWAQVITGNSNAATPGIVFESPEVMMRARQVQAAKELSAEDRVKQFLKTASAPAWKLAGLMAAVPVSLPVARLIQQTMVPEAGQVHLAEVFLSGLIQSTDKQQATYAPEQTIYDFLPGIRPLLLQNNPVSEVDEVLDRVSEYIAAWVGISIRKFEALLEIYDQLNEEKRHLVEPFAELTPYVLRQLGGTYTDIAEEIEANLITGTNLASKKSLTTLKNIPIELRTVEFDVPKISFSGTQNELDTRIQMFILYSYKDEPLRNELAHNLSILQNHSVIKSWHDGVIAPGEEWADEINKNMNQSDIILLLISADFLASDYCYGKEIQLSMERHRKGEAIVIPIVARSVDWSGTPFSKLQALPKNAKAITNWPNLDEAFASIVEGVNEVAEQFLKRKAATSVFLEIPSGCIPFDSPFYIERPPIEDRCYDAILKSGTLIRIKAPRQMGKTSLMLQVLHQAENAGFKVGRLSFQMADEYVISNLESFLRWVCNTITFEFGLEMRLDDFWDASMGSKVSCTIYFEQYLLQQVNEPIVLGLDEVDIIFQYPEITSDFLGMLRSWNEMSKTNSNWEKLRIVVVHSSELYAPMNLNQSPFNVGMPIELPDFSDEQILALAKQHRLNWQISDVKKLMSIVGGHPYLIRNALYHIAHQDLTLDELLETAFSESGLYGDHLRRHRWNLLQEPNLEKTMRKVALSDKPVKVDPVYAFQLQSMGLVSCKGSSVMPRYDLYRQYFCRN